MHSARLIKWFQWAFILLCVFTAAWGVFSSHIALHIKRTSMVVSPEALGLRYETLDIPSRDIQLKAWFIPAAKPSDTTIVLAHGWGDNKSGILYSMSFLALRGPYNLLAFDFTNHGESGGDYSTLVRLEPEDIHAAVRFLKTRKPRESRHIGAYGFSMGGGAAICAAGRNKLIEAVASECSFATYNHLITHYTKAFYHLPRIPFAQASRVCILARLGYDPEPYSPLYFVKGISPRPLFLLYGSGDYRTPLSQGTALFEAAGQPKSLWVVPGADHGDIYLRTGYVFEDKILSFFQDSFSKNRAHNGRALSPSR